MANRQSFKTDVSFLEKISIGATGTKKVFDELGLTDKIDLISVSKDDNHKSSIIHTTNGKTYSILSNTNYSLLGKVQEEVHRFAINFHRKKESKKIFL